jgi:hypothetical protein
MVSDKQITGLARTLSFSRLTTREMERRLNLCPRVQSGADGHHQSNPLIVPTASIGRRVRSPLFAMGAIS